MARSWLIQPLRFWSSLTSQLVIIYLMFGVGGYVMSPYNDLKPAIFQLKVCHFCKNQWLYTDNFRGCESGWALSIDTSINPIRPLFPEISSTYWYYVMLTWLFDDVFEKNASIFINFFMISEWSWTNDSGKKIRFDLYRSRYGPLKVEWKPKFSILKNFLAFSCLILTKIAVRTLFLHKPFKVLKI